MFNFMMKRFVFAFILLLLAQLSMGQKRVYNSGITFSIIPIEGWGNYSKRNNIVFAQKLTGFKDRYQENISIETYPANNLTLDELWDFHTINVYPVAFKKYAMKQTGESKINGMDAKWIAFTNKAKAKRQTFYNLVYMIVENNIMYSIICVALEKDYKSVEKDFQKMIHTFRIEGDPEIFNHEEIEYAMIDEKPMFNGDTTDMDIEFHKYISSNVTYPKKLQRKGVIGRVIVDFIIDVDGSVTEAEVTHGVHPLLDAEALRVIQSSPKWSPGIQDGKPIRVRYTFPLNFRLE
ncbi:MAG: energy transducer TonB [Bacteroidales bacterium]|nr:energy transducer TonB [Bacteroidales bacterium]